MYSIYLSPKIFKSIQVFIVGIFFLKYLKFTVLKHCITLIFLPLCLVMELGSYLLQLC